MGYNCSMKKNKEWGDDLELLSKYSQITNTHFKVHKLYDTSISTWRKTYTTIELNWFQIPTKIVQTMLVNNDISSRRVVEAFIISCVFPCPIVKNYSSKATLMALLMQFHCVMPQILISVCVCWVPHRAIIGLNWALLTTTRSPNCNLTSPFKV